MGGGPSKEEFESVKRENSQLRAQYEEVQAEIERLRTELTHDRRQYDNVRAFMERWCENRTTFLTFVDSAAIIGPKGIGKSTFLWMKCPNFRKPERRRGNGTVETHYIPESGFTDTIGINIETMPLIRLLVLFIIKGVPKTAVFCTNDRIERVVAILNHLLITRYYVLAMDVRFLHRYYNTVYRYVFNPAIRDAFDEFAYGEWRDLNQNCLRCDAETPLPLQVMNTFEEALNSLFPSDRISMVDYATFMDPAQEDRKSIRTIAYLVCREMKAFYEEYGQNEARFMDQR